MARQNCEFLAIVFRRYMLISHSLFMHGGFTDRISSFDWNKNDPWLMLGAADDNQMQIFRPSRKLVEPIPKTTNHGEVSD